MSLHASCTNLRSIWRRQRLADKYALTGPRYALPISFNKRFSMKIMVDHDTGVGKLTQMVTRLNHSTITAGCSRFQPAQAAHLFLPVQHAPGGGQMIGDRARDESYRIPRLHL